MFYLYAGASRDRHAVTASVVYLLHAAKVGIYLETSK